MSDNYYLDHENQPASRTKILGEFYEFFEVKSRYLRFVWCSSGDRSGILKKK